MGARALPLQALVPLLVVLGAAVAGSEGAPPVVGTRQGRARGVCKQASAGRRFLAFYNLPYAKPPVGPLRFRSPQPPDPWEHIRDATSPGPQCTQNSILSPSLPPSGAEDCLYLNVFTPELKPAKLLPVMFWIHGRGWITGAASWYHPEHLLEHDVVLVTTNYRLGPLGFLSTEDEAAPGNFGLKDQVAALRWVKENIQEFGGDPGSVTIFGESAGAGSVHYLMLSPLAKGLFHRAISQSGVAVAPWAVPLPGAGDKARRVAQLVGCPAAPSAAMLHCLRAVDDYTIVATEAHFLEWLFQPLIPFRPVVEGDGEDAFLPEHPVHLQPHTAVPWLVGINRDEGCLQTAAFVSNETLLWELEQDRERLFPLSLLYHKSPQQKTITKRIQDFYFPTGEFPLRNLTDLYSDALFIWNADEAVRKYKDSAPVYYYLFSYEGQYSIGKTLAGPNSDLGVCHGDDLIYLFSKPTFLPKLGELPVEDKEIVRLMVTLWTNFAATGNPTPNGKPVHWPRVTSDGRLEYLEIGERVEVKRGLFQERVDFWRSLPLREPENANAVKEDL